MKTYEKNGVKVFCLESGDVPDEFFTHKYERDVPRKAPTGDVTINIMSAVEEVLGPAGAMIGGSKSGYTNLYRNEGPERLAKIYFNACLFIEDGTQVWFGDIDLENSEDRLLEVAAKIGQKIFLTPEMPYRFDGLKRGLERDQGYAESRVRVYEP